MTDSLVPDWIKSIKQQQNQEAARAEAAAKEQLLIAKTIQADGPEFWKSLIKELRINTDRLPEIGIRAELSELAPGREDGYQIRLTKVGAFPAQTYTNVFY